MTCFLLRLVSVSLGGGGEVIPQPYRCGCGKEPDHSGERRLPKIPSTQQNNMRFCSVDRTRVGGRSERSPFLRGRGRCFRLPVRRCGRAYRPGSHEPRPCPSAGRSPDPLPTGPTGPKAKGQQRSHTAGRQAAQPPRPAPGGPKPGGRPTAAGAAGGARRSRPQGTAGPRGGGHSSFPRWLCSAQGSGRGTGYHYLIIGRYSVTLSPRGCYEQSFQGCFRGLVFGPGEALPRRQPGGLGVRKAHLPGGGLGGAGPEGRKGSAATGATITRRPGPGHAPGPGTGAGTGIM